MPVFTVADAGAIGIIRDVPGYELPPNAWTNGNNVRMRDGSVHSSRGYADFISPPAIAPYFVHPVQTPTSYYWVYLGLQRAVAQRGVYHFDITRSSLYTMAAYNRWNATNLGGVHIFNNGVDLPQYWAFPTTHLTSLADLTNWPATYRCSVMRAYKNYLVATNVTKASVRYPNLVKWSHGADIGAIPTSWDETNATLDAGEYPLPHGGEIIDQLVLGDINVLYSDTQRPWGMQYIGGAAIFRFWQLPIDVSLLAQECVAEFNGGHFVVTPDDVVVHNAQEVNSVGDGKVTKDLHALINSAADYSAFVLHHRSEKEMWVCFPSADHTSSVQTYVWSYGSGAWSIRDIPYLTHAAAGIIDPLVGPDGLGTYDTWSQGSYDSATGNIYDVSSTAAVGRPYNSRALGLVGAAPSTFDLWELDSTNLAGDATLTTYIERQGLTLGTLARDQRFQVQAIYPHFEGDPNLTDGMTAEEVIAASTVYVYAGAQMVIGGTVNWSNAKPFVVGTDYKVDFKGIEGRFIAVKFQSTSDMEWHLKGYDIDYIVTGKK